MGRRIRHAGRDIVKLRNIEAYAAVAVAGVLAVLSIVGDIVSVDVKWAALLAALAILVYRTTVPVGWGTRFEDIAADRSAFDSIPLTQRWSTAREIWVFAPSGVNVLSARTCEFLRTTVLSRSDAVVRVVVLDPENRAEVEAAARQLDDSLDYPVQSFELNLRSVAEQLARMSAWQVAGSFEYRFASYNPGFSLVITDPSRSAGSVVVEFHAFHNETTHSRMHLELTPGVSDHWYSYWRGQFDHIWAAAERPPGSAAGSTDRRVGPPVGGTASPARHDEVE